MNDDALFDLEYGHWFNLANERLFRRLDLVLNVVQLVGGSAAALGAINHWPAAVVGAGVALALCSALAVLVQPGVRAEQHRAYKAQWRQLLADAPGLDAPTLLARVRGLQAGGPTGLRALEVPAFNRALDALGFASGHRRLGRLEAMANLVA